MASNSDAAAFSGISSTSSEGKYIYRVYFDITLSIEENEEPVRMSDSLDCLAGQDAREALSKVEEFVMNSDKYTASPIEFFVTGVKRLAGTEI